MSLRTLSTAVNRTIDRWLTAPEIHAAGRMGLFRILYGVFYLWTISSKYFADLGQMPAVGWQRVYGLRLLSAPPPVLFFQIAEFLLVFALVLLIVGYRVRLVTVVILIVGTLLEGARFSFGAVTHDSMFLVFYIPLFMALGQWGATYSLDAVLGARRSQPTVAPSNPSWRFIWPMRALLLVLCLLFLSAFLWKTLHGSWVSNPNTFSNLLLRINVEITDTRGAALPIVVALTKNPLIPLTMQIGTLVFEGFFFLALFSRSLRNGFVTLAILFHILNAFLLNVTFVHIAIVYAVFVDWQALYARYLSALVRRIRFPRLSTPALVGGAVTLAGLVALLWTQTGLLRSIISVGGLLTPYSFWLVLLPFAALALISNVRALVRSSSKRAGRGPVQPSMTKPD